MTNTEMFEQAFANGMTAIVYDIETSPVRVWLYQMHDTSVPYTSIDKDTKITSVAWMFQGDKQVSSAEWGVKQDDRKLLRKITKLINKADLVIGQNINSFDTKIVQWRNNLQRLPLVSRDITSVDILTLSRRVQRPTSHKLGYRSEAYGLKGKIPQDMRDCIAVANGDRKAQARRIEYNKKDVLDTQASFWRELDLYPLSVKVKKVLEKFITIKEFCKHCKKYKHQAYDLTIKGMVRQCNNCRRLWKVKK